MPVIINNRNQSNNRLNFLQIAGVKEIGDRIQPKNGDRILGGYGAVYFNEKEQASGGEDDDGNTPITPPDCPTCGGIEPPENDEQITPDTPQGCTPRSLDELGSLIENKVSEDFCEETPIDEENEYFPVVTSPDGELRISCPVDDCEEEEEDTTQDTLLYAWVGTMDDDYLYVECELKSTKEITEIKNQALSLIASATVGDLSQISPQHWENSLIKNSAGKYQGILYYSQDSTCECTENGCNPCFEPSDFGVLIMAGQSAEGFCRDM